MPNRTRYRPPVRSTSQSRTRPGGAAPGPLVVSVPRGTDGGLIDTRTVPRLARATASRPQLVTEDLTTGVCVAGGGPAGVMLGLLLARAGIDVVVLETPLGRPPAGSFCRKCTPSDRLPTAPIDSESERLPRSQADSEGARRIRTPNHLIRNPSFVQMAPSRADLSVTCGNVRPGGASSSR